MNILGFLMFLSFAGVIVISALGAIFAKKIVHSVLCAVVSFLAVAGLFFTLNADFIGSAQLVIYGVGVSILLAFGIMFTAKEDEDKLYLSNPIRLFLGIIAAMTLLSVMICFVSPDLNPKSDNAFLVKQPTIVQMKFLKKYGTSKIIGKRIFCDYVLPFELLSLLLLGAIVGTGYLAVKEREDV
jgi:NADH:ubiquinone oxidoreductase subunit 6 (subunit J)